MQKFNDILLTLDNSDHIDRIEIYKNNTLVGAIENKPGSQGSIKVYQHLWKLFGAITLDAAIEGLDLYSEHTEDAQRILVNIQMLIVFFLLWKMKSHLI